MPLLEETVVDRIEVIGEYNHVQIRTATRIYENDELISKSFHRHVVTPLDDVSNEDAEVQALCTELHTQDVKDAYQTFLNNQENVQTADATVGLTKESKIDKITINEDRELCIRTALIIKKDGIEISKGYSEEIVTPLDSSTGKHDKVKKLKKALHSKKVKDKYKKIKALKNKEK